jgi:hypothetical protein
MAILDLVLGRPLASAQDKDERVGSFAGVSVFGLDALSSAGYGPEAALTILIPLGVAGLKYSLPITIAVSSILAIVFFSYRQTISAYPSGAGTYSVAKENLGRHLGLLGAVALLIDYTLNVAVGISAGIGALGAIGCKSIDPVQWRDGQVDPAVRDRRVPCIHAVTSRDGSPLAQRRCSRFVAQCDD